MLKHWQKNRDLSDTENNRVFKKTRITKQKHGITEQKNTVVKLEIKSLRNFIVCIQK